MIAISIPVVNAATYLRETMRLRFRQWSYVAAAVMAAIVSATVSVVLVVGFDAGIEAVFVGAIFGNALGVAYGIYVSHRDIGHRFSRPELRVMLAYGIPLVPAALAMWALALVDRVMLSRLGNLAEVGQYAVANRVASLQLLVVTAFSLAFGPYIFSIYSEDPEMEKAVRAKSLTYFAAVLLIVGLVLDALRARGARGRGAGLRPRLQGGRAALLRMDRLRDLGGRRLGDLVRAPDALAAVHRRGRRGRQHRPELRPDPAVRDGGRRDRGRRRVRRPRRPPAPRRAARLPDGLRDREARPRVRDRCRLSARSASS